MIIYSWNVNGLRAALKKDLLATMQSQRASIWAFQEIKAREDQIDPDLFSDYFFLLNSAEKPGYSGTALFFSKEKFTRLPEIKVGVDEIDDTEGRVITADLGDFFLVNVYTPNAQEGLRRIEYRQDWDAAFLLHCKSLAKKNRL